MKELINGDEFKSVLLKTLLRFNEFCKEHNIKYTIAYGTALGAVRHKGFIPWDDDVDVIMMRSEYDKFEKAWKTYIQDNKDQYELWSEMDENSHYMGSMGKFFDTNTILYERFPKGRVIEYGIYMDIFVIDSIPVDINAQQEFFKTVRKRSKMVEHFQRHFKGWSAFVEKYRLPLPTLKSVAKRLVEYKTQYNNRPTSLIAVTIDYRRYPPFNGSIFQYEWFQEFELIEFEGHQLPIVKAYDEMLKSLYGDYMQLPPEEERVGHKIEAYWKCD